MRRWDALAEWLPTDDDIIGAEVGVDKGVMSEHLLRAVPRMTLYLVDRWSEYTDAEKAAAHETSVLPFRDSEYFAQARRRVEKIAKRHSDRCHIIVDDSARAADRFADASLDFVFIDADHLYESVKRDIRAWLPKVKPCGVIGGHDYTLSDDPKKNGVRHAVDEICPHVTLGDNSTWFYFPEAL